MNITYEAYVTEVAGIAQYCINEALEYGSDLYDMVHQYVDGHQWIIYYAHNQDVLDHSENPDAWTDCYSNKDLGTIVAEDGMDGARMIQAYCAMHQDVTEKVYELVDGQRFTQKRLGMLPW